MAREDDASAPIAQHATEPPAPSPPSAAGSPMTGSGRGAMLVTAGILLSRVFGLVRQRIIGHYFGIGPFADVITAAFRVGSITQNLLGEGTLSASFIPEYARTRAAGRPREATRFALTTLGFLALAVGAASAVGVALAPMLARLIAPGFEGEPLALTTSAARVLLPMTGLLVLSAWALGVLNAHRWFFLAYVAPTVWSAVQIAALVAFGEGLGQRGEPLLRALVWSAFAGAVLQVLVLLPAARALLGELRPRLDRADPHLREAVARLPNVLLGRGVIQISSLIDFALVSLFGTGAQAAMNAPQMICFLPMAILGTGEAAAALPDMAIGDTRTPARHAIWRVVASTVGSLVLMQWLEVVGVVLGAVVAAWVETFALGWKLRRQLGGLGLEHIPSSRIAMLGAIFITPALVTRWALPAAFARSFSGALIVLAAFGVAFAIAAPALGLFDIRSMLRRGARR